MTLSFSVILEVYRLSSTAWDALVVIFLLDLWLLELTLVLNTLPPLSLHTSTSICTVKLQGHRLKPASSLSCSEESSYKIVSVGTDMWTIQGGHVNHLGWAEAHSRVPSPGSPLQWGWHLPYMCKELRGRQFLTLISSGTLFFWYGINTHVFWQPHKMIIFLTLGKSYWSLRSMGSDRQECLWIDCHQGQGTNWKSILQNMQ